MSSALSPDRYPRLHPPRAFVYHGESWSPSREAGPGATVPGGGGAGRRGTGVAPGLARPLTSPPCHPAARFLNLVPPVPAPVLSSLQEAETAKAARIGRRRRLWAGPRGETCAYWRRLGARWPAQAVLPRPFEGDLEDARLCALPLHCSCGPKGSGRCTVPAAPRPPHGFVHRSLEVLVDPRGLQLRPALLRELENEPTPSP